MGADPNATGSISPYLGALARLKIFNFNDNHITGPLPPALSSLPELGIFCCGDNDDIQGVLTFWRSIRNALVVFCGVGFHTTTLKFLQCGVSVQTEWFTFTHVNF